MHIWFLGMEFYSTALHELMYWSKCRLEWEGCYAEGELRAEIGACYAAAELNVPQSDDLTNNQAYMKSWLAAVQRDPRVIFAASTADSKAADFVLSFSRKSAPANPSDAVLVGLVVARSKTDVAQYTSRTSVSPSIVRTYAILRIGTPEAKTTSTISS